MKERFCCWCGKIETTETCQDPGLKKITQKIAKYIIDSQKKERKK